MHRLPRFVLAIVLLAVPSNLMAGGPPRLCLPINNISAENEAQCSKHIMDHLGKDRVPHISFQEFKGQWYATLFMREDVKLSEVHDALAGSSFSVPKEKLTLIGPSILTITVRTKFLSGFYSDLAQIDGLEISDKSRDDRGLVVTINTSHLCRDLNDAASKKKTYPSFDSIKKLLDDHNADLTDVVWSGDWTCRGIFGCTITPTTAQKP